MSVFETFCHHCGIYKYRNSAGACINVKRRKKKKSNKIAGKNHYVYVETKVISDKENKESTNLLFFQIFWKGSLPKITARCKILLISFRQLDTYTNINCNSLHIDTQTIFCFFIKYFFFLSFVKERTKSFDGCCCFNAGWPLPVYVFRGHLTSKRARRYETLWILVFDVMSDQWRFAFYVMIIKIHSRVFRKKKVWFRWFFGIRGLGPEAMHRR